MNLQSVIVANKQSHCCCMYMYTIEAYIVSYLQALHMWQWHDVWIGLCTRGTMGFIYKNIKLAPHQTANRHFTLAVVYLFTFVYT